MIVNFEAYKALSSLSAKENYIFTSCSPALINDIKTKSQNSKHSVFINVSVTEINIEEISGIDNYSQSQWLQRNLLITYMVKKLLELFPELETSIKDMLGYIYMPDLNINSIIENIIHYYNHLTYNGYKYWKLSFDLFTSLILKLKYIKSIDVFINFYITDGANTVMQRAINDYIDENLPFPVRIFTVYSNLTTYRQSNGKVINNSEKLIYSAENITSLPKTNKI